MNENRISAGGQIRIYAGKCFRLFWSEKQWKKLISTLIIMGIISLVTDDKMFKEYPATKNGAFAVICACIWVGLFNSIQSICRERAIIKREHRTGLRLPSYVMAHVLYELALCAIEAAIVLTIVFLRNADHLPDSGIIGPRVVDMYISFLLIIFASDLIAMLVSCIVKNENEAMTVMPFVLIVQLVMSGAVFELSGVTELISKFTISRWGLDAIGSIACTTFAVSSGAMFAGAGGWKNESDNLLKCWLLLLAFCAAYTLLAMLALKSVDRDKR